MKDQGFGKVMKKALTGEGIKLMKCEGVGKVFCAEFGKTVCVIEMNGESLSINGNDVLAMSGSLKYDIKFVKSAAMLAGGLFNVRVRFPSFFPAHPFRVGAVRAWCDARMRND